MESFIIAVIQWHYRKAVENYEQSITAVCVCVCV